MTRFRSRTMPCPKAVYFLTEAVPGGKHAEAIFGAEMDDEASALYAYAGWLPVVLSGGARDEPRPLRVKRTGDAWLTRNVTPDTEDPDLTADDALAEIEARCAAGMPHFGSPEPPVENYVYTPGRMAEDMAEAIEKAAKALRCAYKDPGRGGHWREEWNAGRLSERKSALRNLLLAAERLGVFQEAG